jgi:hypothetical protein
MCKLRFSQHMFADSLNMIRYYLYDASCSNEVGNAIDGDYKPDFIAVQMQGFVTAEGRTRQNMCLLLSFIKRHMCLQTSRRMVYIIFVYE